ncbi:MAG TPA: hypothetical protein VFV34_08810 [Blastocatellia bacterium]|nr:hypothetical protein [Blastocatellia bacterium]
MRSVVLLAATISIVGLNGLAFSQSNKKANTGPGDYLSGLPKNLKLKEDGPQKYKVVCDYFNLDTLGNLTGKDRVAGEYIRAFPDGKVKWTNVTISHAKGFDDPFDAGNPQTYMQDFSYPWADHNAMFKEEFFKSFPANEPKTKNLVWDMYMVEQFAWDYFDKLELNQPYAIQSSPEDVPLAGTGTFQNRQVVLTWIGVSKRNNEPCALIQYHAFDNKFNTSMGTMTFQGRSHYWGEIWVSLKDKQVEYATLYEDVLVQFTIPGQSGKQYLDVLRKGWFEKIQ